MWKKIPKQSFFIQTELLVKNMFYIGKYRINALLEIEILPPIYCYSTLFRITKREWDYMCCNFHYSFLDTNFALFICKFRFFFLRKFASISIRWLQLQNKSPTSNKIWFDNKNSVDACPGNMKLILWIKHLNRDSIVYTIHVRKWTKIPTFYLQTMLITVCINGKNELYIRFVHPQ